MIEVKDGELVNISFRKFPMIMKQKVRISQVQGASFIEMYELRRWQTIEGTICELLASLIESMGM